MRIFPPTTHESPDAVVVFCPTTTEGGDAYLLNQRRGIFFAYAREMTYQDHTIDASILTITTKAQVNGFGTNAFSLTLVSRQDEFGYFWDEKIFPNDVVVIMAIRPSIDKYYHTLMIGFAQRIERQTQVSQDGRPSRVVTISGSDLTGFFNYQYIVTDQSLFPVIMALQTGGLTTAKITVNYIGEILKKICAPVDQVFTVFMDNYALHDMHWMTLHDGTRVRDIFQYASPMDSLTVQLQGENRKLNINGMVYSQVNGSTTAFIDNLLQKPFNEILITYHPFVQLPYGAAEDLRGKCELCIRAAPFIFDPQHDPTAQTLPDKCGELLGPDKVEQDQKLTARNQVNQSFSLFYHFLTDTDVISDNLGRSLDNLYTVFLVNPRSPYNQDISPSINAKPGYYLPSIRRFGLKPLIVPTDYTTLPNVKPEQGYDQEKKNMLQTQSMLSHALSSILKQWFIKNPEFYTGTLEVKGSGKYRPGDVLIYDSEERQAVYKLYIDRVTHKFINFQYFTTELSLSRGVMVKNKRVVSV